MIRRCKACSVQWQGDFLSDCWSCGRRGTEQGVPVLIMSSEKVCQTPDLAVSPGLEPAPTALSWAS